MPSRFRSSDALFRRLLPDLLAIMLLQALCVFFFWQLYPPTAADQIVVRHDTDFAYQGYNYSEYHAARFVDGDPLPLWNPYNMAGSPFLADSLAQAAYPPRLLLLAIFGADWSYWSMELEIVLHYLLINLLMYVLVRRMTGRVLGGLVGSIAFTFSGFMNTYPILHIVVTEAGAWLPLLIWGIFEGTHSREGESALDFRRIGWLAISGIALAIMFFAGNPQTTYLCGIFGVTYFSYRVRTGIKSWGLWIVGGALFGGVGLAISAVNLLPTTEYIPINTRLEFVDYFAKSAGFSYQSMLQILWATANQYDPWYIGMIGLVLIVLAAYFHGERVQFWLIAAVLAFMLGFGGRTPIFKLLYVALPGFNFFQHYERALLITTFCVAIMMAWGAISLVERLKQEHLRWFTGGLIALCMVTGWYFLSIYNISGGEFDILNKEMAGYTLLITLLMTAIMLWLVRDPTPQRQAVLVGLLVFDLFSVSQGSDYVYQKGNPDNVLLPPVWVDDMRANFEADPFARIDTTDFLGPYGSMYQVPDIQGTWLNPLRLRYISEMHNLPDLARWDLLAVRYVLSEDDPSVPAERILGPYNYLDRQFYVYELVEPGPLARLVYNWGWIAEDETIARLSAPDYDVRASVMLIDPPPVDIPGMETRPDDAAVTLHAFEPEKLTLTATTSENALLLVSIPWHPGWRASSDVAGDLDMQRGDHGLMVVSLPAGVHNITLAFEPDSYRVGLPITLVSSLLTGIGLVLWVVLAWRRDARRK